MLAVRKAPSGSHNPIRWVREFNGEIAPKMISGAAFLPTLFSLFGWRKEGRYRVIGTIHKKGSEAILIFNTRDAVLFLTEDEPGNDEGTEGSAYSEPPSNSSSQHYSKRLKAYPAEWAHSFGEQYYSTLGGAQLEEPVDGCWKTDEKGTPYKEATADVTTQEEAAVRIRQILGNIGVEDESI